MTTAARILELRRRVESDPSSIVFAQLAEELRRSGAAGEAIEVCRTGLARHVNYLSARVTLGRALSDLGEFDEAHRELAGVLAQATDNLAALRALGELHQRRDETREAHSYYRRALELAPEDAEVAEIVQRLESLQEPTRAPHRDAAVEALFDFDRLVEQLRAETPPGVRALDAFAPASVVPSARRALSATAPNGLADDAFERLEAELRERERRAVALRAAGPLSPEDEAALAELEDWLAALQASRR